MYEYFEYLLKLHGVRPSQVAKSTGLPPSLFTDWKKNRYKPKYERLLIIANYFDVPVENFFTKQQLQAK